MNNWYIFRGNQPEPHHGIDQLLDIPAPRWRKFSGKPSPLDENADDANWKALRALVQKNEREINRGKSFRIRLKPDQSEPPSTPETKKAESTTLEDTPSYHNDVLEAVNAALYLRRPLLITGKPGSGKTSLAYAIAYELNLGPVLMWPITARTTLQAGLYQYDAIARLQDSQLSEQLGKLKDPDGKINADEIINNFKDIGQYIRLGPVGTAFLPSKYPRVLLIDEIDKSDINMPNELLNLFEEGEFDIPPLRRLAKQNKQVQRVETDDGLETDITDGRVRCREFPLIIMTSNGERDFPPAFYRRCLRVDMPTPNIDDLKVIVNAHLGPENVKKFDQVIQAFVDQQTDNEFASLPTDQLLNLIYLLASKNEPLPADLDQVALKRLLFSSLTELGSRNG